jgi:OPA family glycerol-3-phosphate transporter-like MFS transporter
MTKALEDPIGSGRFVSESQGARETADQQPFMTMKERKRYNKWRLRILISVILGYAAYYLCRQNFSMIMPAFMAEFGYSKTELGLMLTASSVVYGIGKFVNGYISDKSNSRYFMPFGLFCSALVTFALGFSSTLLCLGCFWVLNNWFQSMGWPPVARMLTHWFAPKELGTKWALGAASHQVGGAITIVFSGYLVANFGWRSAFFIPGVMAASVAIWLVGRLRESPKEVGLPPVEAYKGQEDFKEDAEESHLPTIEIIKRVFVNKKMWYVCFANMCLYIVRLGIIYWAPLFLTEYKGYTLTEAGWQVALYDVIGLAGGFGAGWLSDKVFKGQRGPVGTVYMFALALALLMFWKMPADYELFTSIALILVGFFVYGPQVLAGVASADFASKKAIGTANGLVGAFGYIGSGLSGICVGVLSDLWGWGASFIFFIIAALLGSLFFYLTWNRQPKDAIR